MIKVTAEILPEDFKKIRLNNDMTQAEMAEFLGVSVGAVKQFESGKSLPSLDNLAKMTLGFGIGFNLSSENIHPLLSERLSEWKDEHYIK